MTAGGHIIFLVLYNNLTILCNISFFKSHYVGMVIFTFQGHVEVTAKIALPTWTRMFRIHLGTMAVMLKTIV